VVVPVLATDVAAVGEAEAMLLMNQPCEAGREACDSICPMTIPEVTAGTSANVRVPACALTLMGFHIGRHGAHGSGKLTGFCHARIALGRLGLLLAGNDARHH